MSGFGTSSWDMVPVDEVLSFVGGSQPPASTFKSESEEGYVRLVQIRDFYTSAHLTYVPDSNLLRKCGVNDVMIARYGVSVGRVLKGLEGAYNVALVKATPKDGIDNGFLFYLLSSDYFQLPLLAQSARSAQAGFSRESIGYINLPRPPLGVQKSMAEALGALDDKIESNRRVVKKSELLLLAHSNSLSYLPTVALSEVSKSYRRPVNPLVLGDEWVDHFSLPAFDAAAMPERCQASSIMSGKFGIETTSVLISRLNPGTPRVWCAHVREVPAMCSSEFLVLEPLHESSVGALWLAAVHPTLGEQMVQRATGTSFSHQRIKSDDALSVEVPDIRLIDEQTRVECDELIEMVGKRRSETEHLSRLRDALLPELLSGRLRVKDAESMMENV